MYQRHKFQSYLCYLSYFIPVTGLFNIMQSGNFFYNFKPSTINPTIPLFWGSVFVGPPLHFKLLFEVSSFLERLFIVTVVAVMN